MKLKIYKSQTKDSPYTSPRWGDSIKKSTTFSNDKEELNAYKVVEWVAACIDRIMVDAGQDIYFEDQKGQKIEPSRIDRKIILPIQNGFFKDNFNQLIKRALGQRLLTGNAFFLKVKSTAFAQIENIEDQFIPIHPAMVRIIINRSHSRLLGYEITFNNSEKIMFAPDEVIHFKQNAMISPFVGIGNIEKMRLMLEGEAGGQEYMNEFLEKKASPSIAITSEEDFPSLGDYERKMDILSSKYESKRNAGKIMYLAGGEGSNIKITPMSLTQKDMQFLELKMYNRQTVLSMFGLNTTIMGIPEGANNAIATELRIQHLSNINNLLKEMENDFNQQFVNRINPNIFLRFVKYSTGNISEIKEAIATGIMTPNSGSKKIGEPVDETDEARNIHYISSSLLPLGFLNTPINNNNGIEKTIEKEILTKNIDLLNPKNVDAIEIEFLKSATKPKQFQAKYLRKALKDRNGNEDRFAFELKHFFKDQGERIIKRFNDEFGEKKADLSLLNHPEKVASIIYDIDFEGKELKKELKKLHTSGVQKGVNGVNTIAGVNINANLSNPFVHAAIKRLVGRATGFMASGKKISINQTTWADITIIISNGVDKGLTVQEMSDNIGAKFEQYQGSRARMIARTESRAAWDAGAEVAYRELDVTHVDVIGCTQFEATSDCGKQGQPINKELEFHPNHIGVIVPSKEI